jgi:hypothetical protein
MLSSTPRLLVRFLNAALAALATTHAGVPPAGMHHAFSAS